MSKVTRKVIVQVDLTAEEVAQAFCELDSEQQARFFNETQRLTLSWTSGAFEAQLIAIVAEEVLSPQAKLMMQKIGEFAA